jgi:hypothetical protein
MATKSALALIPPGATGIQPPRKLGPHGIALWRAVTAEYQIEDAGGIELLTQACQAADRVEALAERIDKDGEIVCTGGGIARAHPGLCRPTSEPERCLMPTTRRTIVRPRRATFTPEVLKLFAELDATPRRGRDSDEFKTKDRELHRLLGLGGQWFCSCASVTDGSPLRSAGMTPPTYLDHQKVRGVRQQLLAAIREKTAPVSVEATGAA